MFNRIYVFFTKEIIDSIFLLGKEVGKIGSSVSQTQSDVAILEERLEKISLILSELKENPASEKNSIEDAIDDSSFMTEDHRVPLVNGVIKVQIDEEKPREINIVR